MASPDLKQEAKNLMEKRTLVEKQIEGIVARLEVPGGPGVKGSLVDKEVGRPGEAHAQKQSAEELLESIAILNSMHDLFPGFSSC